MNHDHLCDQAFGGGWKDNSCWTSPTYFVCFLFLCNWHWVLFNHTHAAAEFLQVPMPQAASPVVLAANQEPVVTTHQQL